MPRLSPQPAGGATCLEDGMEIEAWYLKIWDGDYGRGIDDPAPCRIVAFHRVWSDGVLVEGAIIAIDGEFRTAALSELYATHGAALAARVRYGGHAATA